MAQDPSYRNRSLGYAILLAKFTENTIQLRKLGNSL